MITNYQEYVRKKEELQKQKSEINKKIQQLEQEYLDSRINKLKEELSKKK